MKCIKCKKTIDKDDLYCGYCGAPQVKSAKSSDKKNKIIIAVISFIAGVLVTLGVVFLVITLSNSKNLVGTYKDSYITLTIYDDSKCNFYEKDDEFGDWNMACNYTYYSDTNKIVVVVAGIDNYEGTITDKGINLDNHLLTKVE